MNRHTILRGWLSTAAVFFCASASHAAQREVVFGLTNTAINGAVLDLEISALFVGNLDEWGYKGVSVQLGESEAGVFFSPWSRESPMDGNFMAGHVYGKVEGLHRRICSVYGWRDGWATYPITVDFLPLGTEDKTIQVYQGDALLGEESYTSGEIIVSTSNDSNIGPRVNPFWRMADGSVGVLLEFSTSPPITLPSGRHTYANRIFIRADHPRFRVDYVSRVDVYGGGGLMNFLALDERVGAFGRVHRALGAAVFSPKPGLLTISNCGDAGTDGVMMELNDTSAFTAQVRPTSLGATGATFLVSATSTHEGLSYYLPAIYFGPLGVENREGENHLRFDLSALGSTDARVDVFDGTNLSGQFITSSSTASPSLGTNELSIISAGVAGGAGAEFASLFVQFAEPATLTLEHHVLRGNLVRVSPVNPTNDIGSFSSFQILARADGPISITNEFAASPPPIKLTIARDGTNVLVSWPGAGTSYLYLETTAALAPLPAWHYDFVRNISGAFRSRLEARIPLNPDGSSYFRLRNPYAETLPPLTGD